MAVDFGGQDITVTAGADLTGKRYHAVKMQTNGTVVLAGVDGEQCVGVVQNAPTGAGKTGRLRINGVSKVVAGAAVEEGAELSANTSGRFVTASAGQYVHAVALEPADADGDIVRAMVVNYQKNA
jgi:hypothetical protein